jgi:putative flippase GtrA
MRKHIHNARDFLLPIIDFFYPPFKRLMNLKTFRYAVCGAANTALGYIVYYISFKYILRTQDLDVGPFEIKSHMAALFMSFLISFPFGFFLMKYVVFSDSNLRGRVQLFRYFLGYMINLGLNYVLLKVSVEGLNIYPTVAQMGTILILILLSYLFQRYFTFRIDIKEKEGS